MLRTVVWKVMIW